MFLVLFNFHAGFHSRGRMVVLFAVLLRRKPGFLAKFLDKMAVGTEREEVPDVHGFILGIFQHLAGGVYHFLQYVPIERKPGFRAEQL